MPLQIYHSYNMFNPILWLKMCDYLGIGLVINGPKLDILHWLSYIAQKKFWSKRSENFFSRKVVSYIAFEHVRRFSMMFEIFEDAWCYFKGVYNIFYIMEGIHIYQRPSQFFPKVNFFLRTVGKKDRKKLKKKKL